MRKIGYSKAQGTYYRYCTVCKHILEFLSLTYHRVDIPLKEVSLTFINDFEYFLREEKKCRTNTVWGYMIVLKHIISIARNTGLLPFNPFAGYINSPEWLRKTYDADNVVSAVLHMDEKTPHIHATVVPIVTGERRKAAAKSAEPRKKQYRKKKADAPRLCTDDVMARPKLKEYQDTYAEAMAKYDLNEV